MVALPATWGAAGTAMGFIRPALACVRQRCDFDARAPRSSVGKAEAPVRRHRTMAGPCSAHTSMFAHRGAAIKRRAARTRRRLALSRR